MISKKSVDSIGMNDAAMDSSKLVGGSLRDLQYALAVDASKSFSRAADRCGVAQATLSGQIRRLEDRLGIELFERDGRNIRTTPVGVRILAEARQAVEAMARIDELARFAADPFVGEIRLGVIPTLAPYLLPHLLAKVREALPCAPLTIVEDVTERVTEALREGKLDALLLASEPATDGFRSELLFEEPFWLAVSGRAAGRYRAPVRLDAIDPETLILLADGHCLRDQALALCGEPHLAVRVGSDLRASSLETVLNLVAAEYGVTIVPALAVARLRNEHRDVALLPLVGGAAREIRLISRPFAPRRRVLDALAALVRICGREGLDLVGKVGLEPT